MKGFKIFVALLTAAVFVTSRSAVADDVGPSNKSFYEGKLYQSEKSMTGGTEQPVDPEPLFEDRHESHLHETEIR